LTASIVLVLGCLPAAAQSGNSNPVSFNSTVLPNSSSTESSSEASPAESANFAVLSGVRLPDAPEPALEGGNPEHYQIVPAADYRQPPFSRVGIGADVSPLGIGLKAAVVLDRFFDARFMGNYFNFNSGRFEVDGFNVFANLHLKSAAALVDLYPFNSIWRASAGLMFTNSNQLSFTSDIVPGTSFDLNHETFYSSTTKPLHGTGLLGLHTRTPAFVVSGGFGKFIPRSNRHWSFPSEFGVAFTGAPTINVSPSGSVCKDKQLTECSDIGDPSNPVAIAFNNSLQETLNKWRKDLAKVQVYPIFSYSVVYSFNTRK
jgi:hypothetical protein